MVSLQKIIVENSRKKWHNSSLISLSFFPLQRALCRYRLCHVQTAQTPSLCVHGTHRGPGKPDLLYLSAWFGGHLKRGFKGASLLRCQNGARPFRTLAVLLCSPRRSVCRRSRFLLLLLLLLLVLIITVTWWDR